MRTTPFPKPGEIENPWYVVDASKEVLGRAATRIARILQGKDRPTYSPNVWTGSFVVVVNAEKIQATGDKEQKKVYDWYSGFHGGHKHRTLGDMRQRKPDMILRRAVRRMLPKSRLGRRMLSALKIYAGPEHPHGAQNPQPLTFARSAR
jgi:large subunit ribosomal protein L13